jgi:hypothetical protein
MSTQHAQLYDKALQAGLVAGKEATPTPMRIRGYEPIADGVCGFATVNVPGNTSFGRWVKKMGHGDKSYRGGLDIWVRQHGQSYERKVAHANAMAEVLQSGGVNAQARGNVD